MMFHAWVEWFVQTCKSDWIKPIDTEEEIETCTADFEKLGFPGAISYMDAVHILYPACPAALRQAYTGKAGVPTIAFNVHCDAKGLVRHVTHGGPGGKNDKTAVRVDSFATKVKEDPLFTEREFQIYRPDGTIKQMRGMYHVCDGGYHRWLSTICAMKHPLTRTERIYTKVQESRRKAIECCFGIMKKRGRILKAGFQYSEISQCNNIVFAWCILHNMLKHEDGLHDIGCEEDDWEKVVIRPEEETQREYGWDQVGDDDIQFDVQYDRKREALMEHMTY
eukprot:9498874-Pyramimonas_sp.AAC.1